MSVENTARLAQAGPSDPVHGFPLWYEDGTGLRLELGLGPDEFLPAVEDPVPSIVVPGMPFPSEFAGEAFYFMAESEMTFGAQGSARLILALEAAFGADVPDPRSRIVFARIRVRIDDVTPGQSYIVTHPYGVTDPLEADDDGRVRWTDDRGIGDNLFDAVRANGLVAPFLQWDAGAPPKYIGDGATEHTVTGSPFGTNLFRIERVVPAGEQPAADDLAESVLFAVQGKIATRNGADITAAHYTRTGGTVVVDVHARAVANQELEVGGTVVARTRMADNGRDYSARAAAASVPTTVDVYNLTDELPSVSSAPVVDLVSVTEAVHDITARTLTVSAHSSDDQAALSVVGFGDLTGSPFADVDATPAFIAVTSAAGGRGSGPVALAGAAPPPLPVVADAGSDTTVIVGETVRLDGSASRSGITGWAWTQTAGAAVAVSDDAVPAPEFTPAQADTYEFTLTVTGPNGDTATDTVEVVAQPPLPDALAVDRAEFRTGRREFRISGTQTGPRPSQVTAHFGGTDLGTSGVDVTGAWAVRRTLAADEDALIPSVGDAVTIDTSRGGTAAAPVQIRN